MFSVVSAVEWDNYYTYDPVTRSAYVWNGLTPWDPHIATLRLNTPLNMQVAPGYNYVFEIDLWGSVEYEDFIDHIYIHDKDDAFNEVTKTIDFKFFDGYDIQYKDVYSCKEWGNHANGTYMCLDFGVTGSREVKTAIWTDLTVDDLVENTHLVIRGYTDVVLGENMEWYIDVFGSGDDTGHGTKGIKEWAGWNASFFTDMEAYYQLNLTSGSVIDIFAGLDGTTEDNGGTPIARGIPGIINNSFDFERSGANRVDLGNVLDFNMQSEAFSLTTWLMFEATGNTQNIFSKQDAGSPFTGYSLSYDASNRIVFEACGTSGDCLTSRNTEVLNTGEWYYITVTYDGSGDPTGVTFYVNSTALAGNQNFDFLTSSSANSIEANIAGRDGGTNTFDGLLDEIGIWSRELNQSEVNFLFGNGTGQIYNFTVSAPGDPSITFNSPASTNFTTAPQTLSFNFTASDPANLTNVQLFVNGFVNQSNATGINNSNYIFNLTLGDGVYEVFGRVTNDLGGTADTETRTYIIDSLAPVVNITSPANGTLAVEPQENLTVNWTIVDTSLDACWYTFQDIPQLSLDDGDSLNSTTAQTVVSGWVLVTDNTSQVWNYQVNDAFGGSMFIRVQEEVNIGNVDSNFQTLGQASGVQNATMAVNGNGYHYFEVRHVPFGGSLGVADLFRAIGPEVNATNQAVLNNCSLNFTNITYPSNNPTLQTFTLFANDTIGNVALDSITFVKASSNITLNITSPPAVFVSLVPGQNIDLDWNITSPVALDTCFYDYNGTNTTVTCGLNTTTFVYVEGLNEISFFVNDTFGSSASQTVNWTVAINQTGEFFVNETVEGVSNLFWVSIQTNESITSGTLVYNGTEFAGIITETSTNNYNISHNLIAPSVDNDTNFTFNWEINLSSGLTGTLATNTQLVLSISLDDCSVFNFTILNISLFEERSRLALFGTIELVIDVLDTVNFESVQELSGEFIGVNQTLVCSSGNLSGQDLVYSAEIKYFATGFESELYFIQRSPFEEVDNVELFDLNTSFSTEFLVEYENENFVIVPGAVIQLQRRYLPDNVFRVVEAPLTSDQGTAILHIDLDSNLYKATIVKDGVVLDIFENLVFACQNELSGECTQNLRGSIDPNNEVNIETSNDFAYSITSGPDTVTTTFSVPSGTTSSVNLLLQQVDGFGNVSLCNKTVVSSAGAIVCPFQNQTITDSYLFLTLNKNGEPQAQTSFYIRPSGNLDFLETNFLLVFIFLLSIAGMAITSPEWVVVNGIMVMMISGALYLLNGLNFVMGLGTLMWLVIAAAILIYKMAQQEDR